MPFLYNQDEDFAFGKSKIINQGTDLALIAAGETVHHALKAAQILKEDKISVRVISM